MAKILLIGAVHEYQRESPLFRAVLEAYPEKLKLYSEQLATYQKWIRDRVHEFEPNLIFDEMNLAEDDRSERLEDTGVPWVYMDIPEHVRAAFGLTAPRSADKPIVEEVDIPRERYWQMVVRTLSEVLSLDRAVVICGAAHLELFSEQLRRDGHELVPIVDVRNEQWANLGWAPPKVAPPG